MEHLLKTIVVFGAIVLVFAILAKFFTDMDECHRKGGVLVNTFFGYDCIRKR
jgi:hypothetical protein